MRLLKFFPIVASAVLILGGCSDDSGERSDIETVETGSEVAIDESGVGADETGRDLVPSDQGEPGTLDDPIPFRGNPHRIEQTMGKVPGAQKQAGSTQGRLTYNGGRFAELPVTAWDFGFYAGQMTFAQLQFRSEDVATNLEGLYDELTEEMNERYGERMFDSDRQVSRALTRYSDEEVRFIEKVGLSIQAGKFRMWTPTDSTADFLITLNMLPNDPTLQDGVVHLAWYDRVQGEAFFNAVEKSQ